MKRFAIITLLAVFALSASASHLHFSENPLSSDTAKEMLKKKINHSIFYPSTVVDAVGIVDVLFFVTKEGKICILECNSENEELRRYVYEKLECIELTDDNQPPQDFYRYRFNFRKEVS